MPMHFSFEDTTPQAVIQRMTDGLEERGLGRLVKFDLSASELVVTIRKLGRSRLVFDVTSDDNRHEFSLREQRVALTHRPFRAQVNDMIKEIVDDLGGQVTV